MKGVLTVLSPRSTRRWAAEPSAHRRARLRPEGRRRPLGLGVEERGTEPWKLQHIHPEPTSFIRKYVFSTDHKVIAKQFLWAGLLFLAFGGTLAMMIRWQWAYPGAAGARRRRRCSSRESGGVDHARPPTTASSRCTA